MPKLKMAMENVSKLASAITKSAEKHARKMDNLSKSSQEWKEGGQRGVQQIYTYVAEKVRQKGLKYKDVSADPISKYADKNVTRDLEGLQMLITMGVKDSEEFTTLRAENKSFTNDLSALEKPLSEAAAMIKKRKKKLLLSKKYKAKLAGYENTLVELQTKVTELKHTVRDVLRPPTPNDIRKALGITADTTLAELEAASGRVVQKLEEYNSLILVLNESANTIRSKAEFAEHMRVIKEMVTEAENLEKEGD